MSSYSAFTKSAPLDLGVRIVADAQRVGAAVDDAVELVDDGDLVVQLQRAGARAAEQLDHHRHLHRAGGVEAVVGVQVEGVAGLEVMECDSYDCPIYLGRAPADALL